MEKKNMLKFIICAITCVVGAFVGAIVGDGVKIAKRRREQKKNQIRMKLSDGRTLVATKVKSDFDGREVISVVARREDGCGDQAILTIDSAHDYAPYTLDRIEKDGVVVLINENPEESLYTRMIEIPKGNLKIPNGGSEIKQEDFAESLLKKIENEKKGAEETAKSETD